MSEDSGVNMDPTVVGAVLAATARRLGLVASPTTGRLGVVRRGRRGRYSFVLADQPPGTATSED
jgi:hypothetical protein